jgi:hypothetical protein
MRSATLSKNGPRGAPSQLAGSVVPISAAAGRGDGDEVTAAAASAFACVNQQNEKSLGLELLLGVRVLNKPLINHFKIGQLVNEQNEK